MTCIYSNLEHVQVKKKYFPFWTNLKDFILSSSDFIVTEIVIFITILSTFYKQFALWHIFRHFLYPTTNLLVFPLFGIPLLYFQKFLISEENSQGQHCFVFICYFGLDCYYSFSLLCLQIIPTTSKTLNFKYLIQGLTMQHCLAWSSICSPSQTQNFNSLS